MEKWFKRCRWFPTASDPRAGSSSAERPRLRKKPLVCSRSSGRTAETVWSWNWSSKQDRESASQHGAKPWSSFTDEADMIWIIEAENELRLDLLWHVCPLKCYCSSDIRVNTATKPHLESIIHVCFVIVTPGHAPSALFLRVTDLGKYWCSAQDSWPDLSAAP